MILMGWLSSRWDGSGIADPEAPMSVMGRKRTSVSGGKRTLAFKWFEHPFMNIEGLTVFKLDKINSPGRELVEVRS